MTQVTPTLRAAVVARAAQCCEYCQASDRFQIGLFEVDHIQPVSRGGETSLENLAYACPHCNDRKWAHTDGTDPVTAVSVRLFHPRLDRWADHFDRPDDSPFEIHGTTPVGRATVHRLQLNHLVFVAVRRELARFNAAE